jgi:four helix bundle protein
MADGAQIKLYRDLRVWQDAMTLAEVCYRLTGGFPREEVFGLSAQIRRAAVSIAANIAEGHGRENTQSFIQYLRIAQGSLKELETHLMLAERVNIAANSKTDVILVQCENLGKMVRSLIRALQTKVRKS